MAENTQSARTSNTPVAHGWCTWHQAYASGVRLIDAHEHTSGPNSGGNRFACPPCMEKHGLVPLADRV
jgi:hypothetical protein